jgi:tetratricopeptide (TPR) repeat protein
MSLLTGVIAGILADKSIDASSAVRQRAAELQREKRFSEALMPIATEFNDALGERLKKRADDVDSVGLYGLAVNWDVVAGDIDTTSVAFESEDVAIDWLVDEIGGHEDVDLGEAAKAELREVLADEYAAAVADFRESIVSDDDLRHRLQTELELDLHDQLAAMRDAFEHLADRQPYGLYDFPADRDAVLDILLSEEVVPFVDRPEVPDRPAVDRYFILAPSGAGKTRIIAEWIRRLPDGAVAHVLVPEARMLDPADARRLARQSFDGDLLLVWEDVHRVDEAGENRILERTLRELAHGLDEQGYELYTLLEARSGRLSDVPGNLPEDFTNDKSLWSAYEPLFVGEVDTTRLRKMAQVMASQYEMELEEGARDALVARIEGTKSAPIYIETALVTAGDRLTVANVEELATEVEDIWQRQYGDLRDDAPAEWEVLVAMKLLYDLNMALYAKLVRAVYLHLLNGERSRFRPALEALHDRQWLTIYGTDLVGLQTLYDVHDTQLEAVQANAIDDVHQLSGLLMEHVEISVPESTRAEIHRQAGVAFGNKGYDTIARRHFQAACDLDPKYAEAYCNRGVAKGNLDNYEGVIEDFDRAIELDSEDVDAYYRRGVVKGLQDDHEGAIEDFNRVIELDPKYAEAYCNRGVAKSNLDNYEGVIEDFSRVLDFDPSNFLALQHRAEARLITGNIQAARQDAEQIQELSEAPSQKALSMLIVLITDILQDRDLGKTEVEYHSLCDQDFNLSWDFSDLDSWLVDTDLPDKKTTKIEEFISILKDVTAD